MSLFQRSADQRSSSTKRKARRRALTVAGKGTAVVALGALGLPFIARRSRAETKTVRMLMWSDYLPEILRLKFEAEYGYRIQQIPYGSNAELVTKLRATGGRGFDLVSPSADRRGMWEDLNLLRPIDEREVPLDRVAPQMREVGEGFAWGERAYMVPFAWGTEGLAWRTDRLTRTYETLSFGDLWIPELQGRMMGRPESMMAGVGRYLASKGELPPFEETYESPERMKDIWDPILDFLIERLSWPKVLWNDAEAQTNGFTQNGILMGQTWDGPIIRLGLAGEPVRFMAPREGAFVWMDGLSVPVGATNPEGAYAFIDFILKPENGALFANLTGYNSVAIGAEKGLEIGRKAAFDWAFPNDAIDNLWPWPPLPAWYAKARQDYSNQFVAAIREA